ncbi:MAG: desulfoferrodoxin family protein [Leptospiraceae bacterium]|nr:desulfoferrodoxin family protein [Leptospiraceae bacterium]
MKLNIFLIFSLLIILSYCSSENEGKLSHNDPIPPQEEYTKESPGEWKGKEAEHLPQIKVLDTSKTKHNIQVHVTGNFNQTHYIEKIGIMDENKNTLDEKEIGAGEEPFVTLSLDLTKESSKKAKVYVKCITHDLWTAPIFPEFAKK